jgi:signal transduction histidine kinase
MASGAEHPPWAALFRWPSVLGVWLPLAAITALHYVTPSEHGWVHDVARRLYYLPIIIGAFVGGLRGGMLVAGLACAVYLPHAFTHLHHIDPAPALQKFLEIVLYLVVGAVGGSLVDRERKERIRQHALALQLQQTLDDLKQTEQALIRAGRLSALGQLTAGLSHEIRNPLHAMRGTAEIVHDALPADGDEARMQGLHIQEIDRLSGMLERFLDFARPDQPSFADVDLAEVVGRTAELVAAQARRGGVSLDVRGAREPVLARGDAEQLVQVLLGLALNGIEALGAVEGERTLWLELRDEERGSRGYHGLAVGNDGPTLPADLAERIFDPFVTTREGGTGLGLSIAARIVDGHGGLIEANDLAGGGVEFVVLLARP